MTVNGRVRLEPGAQADPTADHIAIDGRPLPRRETMTYLLLHKPSGYLSTVSDPAGRPVVLDLVRGRGPRLFPVGRLDYDAEGLLLLTNDGELANRLLHPRYEVTRVYEAEVEGRVDAADLPRWRRGVSLPDGPAVPSAVAILHAGRVSTRLRLSFAEGRNREVKRYCKALGHPVLRLVRVAFGPLRLGRLRAGACRALTASEVEALKGLRLTGPSPILRGLLTEPH